MCVFAQAFCNFETSTILVYMILNGKGCLFGCGRHGYGLISFFFLAGQFNMLIISKLNIFALDLSVFLNYYFFVCFCSAVEEKRRTTPNVS